MGYPLELALRYMRSRKRAFISVGTFFAVTGVALGTAALSTVMGVTGGFRAEFREKILGVNAHVLVLKYSSEFPEYREVMRQMRTVPGVTGVAPFIINPMMVTHQDRTATGILLKGIDPALTAQVLDLPRHIVEGSLDGLRVPGSKPPARKPRELGAAGRGSKGDPLEEPGRPRRSLDQIIRDTLARREKTRKSRQAGKADEPPFDGEGTAPPDAGVATATLAPEDSGDEDLGASAAAGAASLVQGAIAPRDGYQSELPDDDYVPPELVPDPCQAAGGTSRLPGIVVGKSLAESLHARLGDCLQVTSPTIGYAYSRGVVRPSLAKQFRITAVFEAGFDQYDSKLVYTDLYEAQTFYDSGDTVTGVEMKVADIDNAHAVALAVDRKLDNSLYRTLDWEQLNHGLFTALRIQQIVMSLVLALIMLVAAFTVIATLIMVVLDKRREIAVLKAMGATDWGVLRAFLYQGVIMGVLGAAAGLGGGYAACRWILVYGFPLDPKVYFISRLPVQIEPVNFLLTGAFAVLVCLAATMWPALHAARLRPAEAFREH